MHTALGRWRRARQGGGRGAGVGGGGEGGGGGAEEEEEAGRASRELQSLAEGSLPPRESPKLSERSASDLRALERAAQVKLGLLNAMARHDAWRTP